MATAGTPQAAHGHYLARKDMAATQPHKEVTARAQIARARLGLVTKRCLEVPPERMQGGTAFGRDVLLSGSARQRITRAAQVGVAGAHA